MLKYASSVVLLALLIAGCSGKNFARPAPGAFELGKTTQTEIVAAYGEPTAQRTTVATEERPDLVRGRLDGAVVAGSYANLTYEHVDRTTSLLVPSQPYSKALNFIFWNGALVGYNFISDFSADSSNFDEARINAIEKGRSTRIDLIGVMGSEPTGRRIYPLVQYPGEEVFIYAYVTLTGHPGAGPAHRQVKRLEVLFDASGTTVDYRFTSESGPGPSQPGPAIVPVFVPRGK